MCNGTLSTRTWSWCFVTTTADVFELCNGILPHGYYYDDLLPKCGLFWFIIWTWPWCFVTTSADLFELCNDTLPHGNYYDDLSPHVCCVVFCLCFLWLNYCTWCQLLLHPTVPQIGDSKCEWGEVYIDKYFMTGCYYYYFDCCQLRFTVYTTNTVIIYCLYIYESLCVYVVYGPVFVC